MAVKSSLVKKCFLLAILVVGVIGGAEVENVARRDVGSGRHRRSPKWSLGSSSKKATSAPVRATHAPVRATESHFRATTQRSVFQRATTAAYRPPATTSGPIRRATTQGPIYPHHKPIMATTTPRVIYPTQVYPRPVYPVLPNPPPIYVPPPPPVHQNPTIIIVREPAPQPPKTSIFPIVTGIGSGIGKIRDRDRWATPRPTTTTTTTTRRPKTTTEEPWHGIEGGYDRKTWIDFVKSTQRSDVPLSGQWVRIRGGKSMREGYVEIVGEGGLWGSVCDVPGRWDLHKANIVCRQLGYRGGAEAAWQGRPVDSTIVQPSQVREVNCSPIASTLLHCNLRRSKDGHPSEIDVDGTCYGRTRNVGVRCRPEPNTVCKFGEKAFGKSCYRMVLPPSYGSSKEFATLGAEAVKTCRSIARSELVSVTTQAENDFLSDWLQAEYPSVDTVLTSGIGTHSHLYGVKKPLVEWWLWSGQYRDVDYERWWPGWTSKPTITPIVPPKSMMCIVLQNKFSLNDRGPTKNADYFYWKAYNGTSKSTPVAYICERPADDVGCLTPNQEYTGPANISESGKACLNWDSQQVRTSAIVSILLLNQPLLGHAITTAEGNACRRLTLDKEPWCFVSNSPGAQPEPEQCLIPVCGQPSAITSYYEAPKKTNNYAPNYVQIPAQPMTTVTRTSETIAMNLPGFSYSGYSLAAPLTPLTDTISAKRGEETSYNKSDTNEIDLTVPMILRTLQVNVENIIVSDLNGTVDSDEPTRTRLLVEESPTPESPVSLSNETTTTGPSGTPSKTANFVPKLRRLIIKAKPIKSEDITPAGEAEESLRVLPEDTSTSVALTSTGTELPPAECEDRNSTENRCRPNTELPYLLPTLPSLFYPHPENEVVTTTVRSVVSSKPSLYGHPDSIRTRYADGRGRPFERQLSSSDLVLILNGILPQEEVADTQVESGQIINEGENTTLQAQTEESNLADNNGQTESTEAQTESAVAQTESTVAQTESTVAQTESTVAQTESTQTGSTVAQTGYTIAQTESTVAQTESSTLQTESTITQTESVAGQTKSLAQGHINFTTEPTPTATTAQLEPTQTTPQLELDNSVSIDVTATTLLPETAVGTVPPV